MSEQPPILYNFYMSPPVRSVKVVARLIELDLEFRDLDIFNGEHLQEAFISINPEHTVPTLDDNGNILWDSHAISTYLIDKYGENHESLYPKDLYQRARCNQRLFFDNGRLFKSVQIIMQNIFAGGDSILEEHRNSVHNAYVMLEAFLESDSFLVGNQLTVADVSIAVTMEILTKFVPVEDERFPKLSAWIARVKETIDFFDEINDEPSQQLYDMINTKMESNQNKE